MTSRIKEVREHAGMSRPDIFRTLGIPVRTQESWEAGVRRPAPWLESMVIREYKRIANEKENKKND